VSSGELSPGAGPNIPDRTSGADCSAEIEIVPPGPGLNCLFSIRMLVPCAMLAWTAARKPVRFLAST